MRVLDCKISSRLQATIKINWLKTVEIDIPIRYIMYSYAEKQNWPSIFEEHPDGTMCPYDLFNILKEQVEYNQDLLAINLLKITGKSFEYSMDLLHMEIERFESNPPKPKVKTGFKLKYSMKERRAILAVLHSFTAFHSHSAPGFLTVHPEKNAVFMEIFGELDMNRNEFEAAQSMDIFHEVTPIINSLKSGAKIMLLSNVDKIIAAGEQPTEKEDLDFRNVVLHMIGEIDVKRKTIYV
jgi:hypothetical protein